MAFLLMSFLSGLTKELFTGEATVEWHTKTGVDAPGNRNGTSKDGQRGTGERFSREGQ